MSESTSDASTLTEPVINHATSFAKINTVAVTTEATVANLSNFAVFLLLVSFIDGFVP